MKARTAVLRVIHEAEDHAVSETEIIQRFPDGEYRSVKAALKGLADAEVLIERHPFGSEPFYAIRTDIGKRELRQALESVGPGEAATELMQSSPLFDDPTESDDRDLFSGLI